MFFRGTQTIDGLQTLEMSEVFVYLKVDKKNKLIETSTKDSILRYKMYQKKQF